MLSSVAALTLCVFIIWIPLLANDPRTQRQRSSARMIDLARNKHVWMLTGCFGLSSAQAYAILGWYPVILLDSDYSATEAAALLALLTAVGIPTMVSMPLLLRLCGTNGLLALFALAIVAGWLGLLISPMSMGWAWSALIGFGAGSFAWSLSAIGTHCRQPATAATLSGFVQGVGYVIALVDPFGISLLNQLFGSWTPPSYCWLRQASGSASPGFSPLGRG